VGDKDRHIHVLVVGPAPMAPARLARITRKRPVLDRLVWYRDPTPIMEPFSRAELKDEEQPEPGDNQHRTDDLCQKQRQCGALDLGIFSKSGRSSRGPLQ
jgi:hypothetical protein